jgi:hypothetical protein
MIPPPQCTVDIESKRMCAVVNIRRAESGILYAIEMQAYADDNTHFNRIAYSVHNAMI